MDLGRSKRVHVTGGPGSGKTTVARRIAEAIGAPVYDLDVLITDFEARRPRSTDIVAEIVTDIVKQPLWVSEGAEMGWAAPFFEAADVVVWLDVPWRVAGYRILVRHLKAELARNNRHPGWGRLLSFWRWSRRYYEDRNQPRINSYGVPETRAYTKQLLEDHQEKLLVCRTNEEIEALLSRKTV